MKKLSKDQENLAESFRSYLRKKNMSENTENAYGQAIRQFFSIESYISEDQLRKYRSFLISNYSPATINQRIFAINQFLLFLEKECPALDPALAGFRLHSVKAPRDTFQDSIITNEDCEALQTKLKAEHHDFWYFVVRFLVTTGARVSELVQIKVEHLACGYLDLYSKGGKIRRIYIPDLLCQEANMVRTPRHCLRLSFCWKKWTPRDDQRHPFPVKTLCNPVRDRSHYHVPTFFPPSLREKLFIQKRRYFSAGRSSRT